MTTGGVDALKAAIRRSLPLLIGLIVLGIIAVNVFQQARGARYEATSKVLVTSTPLTSIISGTQPGFVDPERVQQTAIGIAESSEVYRVAAARNHQQHGSAGDLQSAVSVSADTNNDLISFTASSSDPEEAVGMANAVARGYIGFRKRLAGAQIADTIKGLKESLDQLPSDDPKRSRVEGNLSRLQVLQDNASDSQLVESATSAGKTSPAPLKDSVVGLSIGLIIGLLLIAIREAVDTTARSEGDVEDLLGLPVLASVRTVPRHSRLVTYGRHEGEFADAYALLAAQLVHTKAGGEGAALAITSAVPKEGKTITAANLAVAVARRGSNAILADFDFRKPGVGETFGLPDDAPGAIQVMAQEVPLESALWSASLDGTRPVLESGGSTPAHPPRTGGIRAPQSNGSLRVLPAGGATRSAPHQEQLQYLLTMLQSEADLVILDTPPALLTVEVAELSRLVDAVLLIVRQGVVTQRNLRALQRQLRTWPSDILGTVMTDVRTDTKYADYGKAY